MGKKIKRLFLSRMAENVVRAAAVKERVAQAACAAEEEVLALTSTPAGGLDAAAVAARREEYGENRLPVGKKRGPLARRPAKKIM